MRCTNVCVPVGPSNATRYTITAADVGSVLRVREIARNGSGSAVVWSAGSVGPVVSVSSAAVVLSGGHTALRNSRGATLAFARISAPAPSADAVRGRRRGPGARAASRPWRSRSGHRVGVCGRHPPGGAPPRCTARVSLGAEASVQSPRVDHRPRAGRRRSSLRAHALSGAESARVVGSLRVGGGRRRGSVLVRWPTSRSSPRRARSVRRRRRRRRCGWYGGSRATCDANGGSAAGRHSLRVARPRAGANTRRVISDPLGLLLEHERRFGPVFTIRLLHEPIVWAIGAEVNHQILVSDFDVFGGARAGSRICGRCWATGC